MRADPIPAAPVPALFPRPFHFIGGGGVESVSGTRLTPAEKAVFELLVQLVKTLEQIVRQRRRRRGRY